MPMDTKPSGLELSCRALAAAGLALALLAAAPGQARSKHFVPDQAVQAGIAACTEAATKGDMLASLCRNRNDLIGLVALCDGVDTGRKRMDATVLVRWDERNAPYLRWIGEFASTSPDESRAELNSVLWDGMDSPVSPGPSFSMLMQDAMQDKFHSLPPDARRKFCSKSRRSFDSGEFDLEVPAGR